MKPAPAMAYQPEWIVVESPVAGYDPEPDHAVLVCDIREKTMLCSQAAARLFGCTPARLEELPIADLLPELGRISAAEHYFNHSHRSLAYYCNSHGWQQFNAVSPAGFNLQVEARITRFEVDNVPLFLLRLRPVPALETASAA